MYKRQVLGSLNERNIAIDASGFLNPERAPSKTPYYEYSLGIGNIFKIFRIDFNFRGNYIQERSRTFGVTGHFGFNF